MDELERIKFSQWLKKFNYYPAKDGLCDKQGRYMTRNLFVDMASLAFLKCYDFQVPYTLKTYDVERQGITYRSLYKIYMDCHDEYDFAMLAFNSYAHFKELLNCRWFLEGDKDYRGYKFWIEEKEMRDKSLNLQRIKAQAELGNVQCLKLIEDRYRETVARGRPSKEDKEKFIQQSQEVANAIEEMRKSMGTRPKLELVKSDASSKTKDSSARKFA